MTQEDAASAAGIDVKRWQRLEAGEVNATVRTLCRVAKALKMTFWDLVSPARR
jgi:transcriptional regulator with XRE-family HTH domain